jgi:hypothetical protein
MSKVLPKYCYIELPGATYILHMEEPFLIGRVWMYKDIFPLTDQMAKINPVAVAYMANYNIAISLWQVLGGRINIHTNSKEEIAEVLKGMVDFYYEGKVKGKVWFDKFLN